MVAAAAVAWLAGVASTPVAAAPRMLKGPYLQDLAPTSITVMWQLAEPRPARLIVTGPGGARTIEVAAARIVEAAVDGLAPGTRYRYRVELVGEDAAWDGELRTAPPRGADVPFTFCVVGDTRSGMDAHRRVVERMSREVPDFILGTGDMVDDGSRQDQWQQFFDVENPLLRDTVYFPAVGNHDRQGRGRTADIYRAYFSVPDTGGSERYYAFTHATSRFVVLDSNIHSFALTDQTAWLERELIAARQDPAIRHVFVVMHHPPFSVSLHGGAVDLRERWTPLFERYAVSAVFSGHDHVYTRALHHGVRYFVSGGGGAPLYPRRSRPGSIDHRVVQRFERAFHYLRVTVRGARVEVTAIRADGTPIETATWSDGADASEPPRPRVVPAASPTVDPAPRVAAGATPAPDPRRVGRGGTSGGSWVALAAAAVLLAGAVAVVRLLRR